MNIIFPLLCNKAKSNTINFIFPVCNIRKKVLLNKSPLSDLFFNIYIYKLLKCNNLKLYIKITKLYPTKYIQSYTYRILNKYKAKNYLKFDLLKYLSIPDLMKCTLIDIELSIPKTSPGILLLGTLKNYHKPYLEFDIYPTKYKLPKLKSNNISHTDIFNDDFSDCNFENYRTYTYAYNNIKAPLDSAVNSNNMQPLSNTLSDPFIEDDSFTITTSNLIDSNNNASNNPYTPSNIKVPIDTMDNINKTVQPPFIITNSSSIDDGNNKTLKDTNTINDVVSKSDILDTSIPINTNLSSTITCDDNITNFTTPSLPTLINDTSELNDTSENSTSNSSSFDDLKSTTSAENLLTSTKYSNHNLEITDTTPVYPSKDNNLKEPLTQNNVFKNPTSPIPDCTQNNSSNDISNHSTTLTVSSKPSKSSTNLEITPDSLKVNLNESCDRYNLLELFLNKYVDIEIFDSCYKLLSGTITLINKKILLLNTPTNQVSIITLPSISIIHFNESLDFANLEAENPINSLDNGLLNTLIYLKDHNVSLDLVDEFFTANSIFIKYIYPGYIIAENVNSKNDYFLLSINYIKALISLPYNIISNVDFD